jgi:hypothetical protein
VPSTYSPLLRVELQASGENDTTWGDKTNNNFQYVVEQAIAGMATINMADTNYTLTVNSGSADEARCAILYLQGTLTAQREVIVPALTKTYVVRNACNQDVSLKTASGTGKTIKAGTTSIVFCDGTNVHSASEPTADGSITPSKLDQALAQAWRLGSALGIGRTQALVPDYGVIGIDGTTGSRITYYVGGAAKGEINGKSTGLDIAAAPGNILTLSTNSTTRVSIDNSGNVAVAGPLSVSIFSASTVTATGNGTFGGTVSASGGFNGITAANVRTAQGFTSVQQGTGVGQNPAFGVKIGWNGASKLKATVENTDLGNLVFESTTGVFIPYSGGGGLYSLASNSIGTGYGSAVQFREVNHAGTQNNSMAAAPGFALHWGNVAAAQIKLQPNAVISFINSPGNAQESIYANTGYFTGDVIAFYSDMRLKTKVGGIDDAMSIIRKLDGFKYVENALARDFGYTNRRTQLGLSAQQVKEVLPELIDLAPFDAEAVPVIEGGGWKSKSGQEYMTVNYQRMVPVLVEALKEQDRLMAKLQEQVAAYQSTLTAVMNRLSELEQK